MVGDGQVQASTGPPWTPVDDCGSARGDEGDGLGSISQTTPQSDGHGFALVMCAELRIDALLVALYRFGADGESIPAICAAVRPSPIS